MTKGSLQETTIHVVNHMAPGGIETLVLDLMRGRATGERVIVISLEGRLTDLLAAWPALREFERDILAFEAPPGRRLGIVPKLRAALLQVAARRVFVHHIGPLLYGGLAARLARVDTLVHVEHDAWHYDQHPGHQRILKWCERLLRPLHFAVSHPIKRRLHTLIRRAAVTVVPPGIDTQRFRIGDRNAARRSLGLPIEGKLIGSAERLATVKGHRFLIDAMVDVRPDAKLVLVGDGEERARLGEQVQQLDVQDRVIFLGHRDDMTQIYPAFDVFCLPSLNEGLPRVIIEAQACGIAVVASDVGAIADAVVQPIGRLVAPGDAGALADGLNAVLGSTPQPLQLRSFVARDFDFSMTKRFYATVGNTSADVSEFREKVSVR